MGSWGVAEWSLVVSAFGAVMAFVAAVYSWKADRRAQADAPFATFSLSLIGNTDDAGDGEPAEVFEFTNQGNAPATMFNGLMLYGCTPRLTVDHRVPPVMLPGKPVQLLLRSSDFTKAFAVMLWTTNGTKSRATMRWLPLDPSGPLGAELLAQIDNRRTLLKRLRLRLKPALRVGPGGLAQFSLSLRRRTPDQAGAMIAARAPEGTLTKA